MNALSIDSIGQDSRHALRALRRSPGFTMLSVLTLALGIGAGTAMFSVLNAILLRDLPVRSQDDVIVMWTATQSRSSNHWPVSYADLTSFGARTRTLDSVAGVIFQGAVDIVMTDAGSAVPLAGTWVTGGFFPLLDVAPVLGRTLAPADDVPGAAPVMTISHALWQQRFGGARDVIGRTLTYAGKRFTIVGVLPRGFDYPKGAHAWFPVIPAFPSTLDPAATQPSAMVFDVVGRLRDGSNAQTARDEFAEYFRSTDANRPAASRGATPVVTPIAEVITEDLRASVLVASAAVALLLLIACINVANLLLVRGSARTQELSIRSALGATRRRLVSALLVESTVLAVIGGVLGVLLAVTAVRVLSLLAPAELSQRELIAIDARTLLAAAGITAVTAVISGVLPALLASRGDPSRWLRGAHAVAGDRQGAQALRHGLVVGQISLSILVVVCAGLVARSLYSLQHVDMGFERERLLIAETMLPPGAIADRARQVAIQEEMIARAAAIPGVLSATTMPKPPFSAQGGWIASYSGEGQSADDAAGNPQVSFEVVGPGYFGTLDVKLLRGRAFNAGDREDGARVAIVSEALARTTWPGAGPIGKRVKLGPPSGKSEWHTVVGIVGDTRYRELASPQPSLYLPTRQFGGPVPMTLAIRTRGNPEGLTPALRLALEETHPDLLLVNGGTVSQLVAAPLARLRFSSVLLGSFAAVTLTLAAVGIYAMLAAVVRYRRRELGIRLALGATAEEVRWFVLRMGMRLAVAGCAIGVAAALGVTRLIQSMLAEISASDPLTYVAVIAGVLALCALSSLVPAVRAGRTQPMAVLRAE